MRFILPPLLLATLFGRHLAARSPGPWYSDCRQSTILEVALIGDTSIADQFTDYPSRDLGQASLIIRPIAHNRQGVNCLGGQVLPFTVGHKVSENDERRLCSHVDPYSFYSAFEGALRMFAFDGGVPEYEHTDDAGFAMVVGSQSFTVNGSTRAIIVFTAQSIRVPSRGDEPEAVAPCGGHYFNEYYYEIGATYYTDECVRIQSPTHHSIAQAVILSQAHVAVYLHDTLTTEEARQSWTSFLSRLPFAQQENADFGNLKGSVEAFLISALEKYRCGSPNKEVGIPKQPGAAILDVCSNKRPEETTHSVIYVVDDFIPKNYLRLFPKDSRFRNSLIMFNRRTGGCREQTSPDGNQNFLLPDHSFCPRPSPLVPFTEDYFDADELTVAARASVVDQTDAGEEAADHYGEFSKINDVAYGLQAAVETNPTGDYITVVLYTSESPVQRGACPGIVQLPHRELFHTACSTYLPLPYDRLLTTYYDLHINLLVVIRSEGRPLVEPWEHAVYDNMAYGNNMVAKVVILEAEGESEKFVAVVNDFINNEVVRPQCPAVEV